MRVRKAIAIFLACITRVEGGRPVDGDHSRSLMVDAERSAFVEMTRSANLRWEPCKTWVSKHGVSVGGADDKTKEKFCCGLYHMVNGGLEHNKSVVAGCDCECGTFDEYDTSPFDDNEPWPTEPDQIHKRLLRDVKDKPNLMTQAAHLFEKKIDQAEAQWNPWGGPVRMGPDGKQIEDKGTFHTKGVSQVPVQRMVPLHWGSGTLYKQANVARATSDTYMKAANKFMKELQIGEEGYRNYYETLLGENSQLLNSITAALNQGLDPYDILSSGYRLKPTITKEKAATFVPQKLFNQFREARFVVEFLPAPEENDVRVRSNAPGIEAITMSKETFKANFDQILPEQLDGEGKPLLEVGAECVDEDQPSESENVASVKCLHCALALDCKTRACEKACRRTCDKTYSQNRIFQTCKWKHERNEMGVFAPNNPLALCYGVLQDESGSEVAPVVSSRQFLGLGLLRKPPAESEEASEATRECTSTGKTEEECEKMFYEAMFAPISNFVADHTDDFNECGAPTPTDRTQSTALAIEDQERAKVTKAKEVSELPKELPKTRRVHYDVKVPYIKYHPETGEPMHFMVGGGGGGTFAGYGHKSPKHFDGRN